MGQSLLQDTYMETEERDKHWPPVLIILMGKNLESPVKFSEINLPKVLLLLAVELFILLGLGVFPAHHRA